MLAGKWLDTGKASRRLCRKIRSEIPHQRHLRSKLAGTWVDIRKAYRRLCRKIRSKIPTLEKLTGAYKFVRLFWPSKRWLWHEHSYVLVGTQTRNTEYNPRAMITAPWAV
ncbi:hypothetical protein C8J57DRAFT_1230271 [Mycena rebaudengoi]|nr:hypothetical protein C8J57DRAFT_1230271 [Mycena rebaudengoi]